MIRTFQAGVWALLLMLPARVFGASIVFSNLDGTPPYDIPDGNFAGNGQDGSGFIYASADTFTPAFTSQLSTIDIALNCFSTAANTCPDAFTVSLDSDGGDVPAAAIENFMVAGNSLSTLGTNNPLVVLNSVVKPTLTSGTQYWIVVSADANDSVVWNWNVTGDFSDQGVSTDGGATWFVSNPFTGLGQTPSAYEINGTVNASAPEPATTALFFAGGLAMVVLRRRRLQ